MAKTSGKGEKWRASLGQRDSLGLRSSLDRLPLPVLILSPGGAPVLSNSEFRVQFGEPAVSNWLDLIEPSDLQKAASLWLASGLNFALYRSDLKVLTPTGEARMQCSVAPVREHDLAGWIVTFSEVAAVRSEEPQEILSLIQESEARPASAVSQVEALEKALSPSPSQSQEQEAQRRALETQAAREQIEMRETAILLEAATARARESADERRAAESRLKEVTCRLTDLQASVADQDARRKSAEARLAEAAARVHDLETALVGSTAQVQEAEARAQQLQAVLEAHDAQLRRSEAERRQIERQLAKAQAQEQAMQGVAQARTAELQHAEAQLARAAARTSELEQALQDSALRLLETQAHRQSAEARLVEAAARVHDLETALVGSTAQVQEAEVRRERAEALEKHAAGLLRGLEARFEDSGRRESESVAQRLELESLLKLTEARLEKASARLGDLEKVLHESTARESAADAERRQREALLSKRENELVQAVAQVSELTEALAASAGSLREGETHRDQPAQERASDDTQQELERQLSETAAQLEHAKARVSVLERHLQRGQTKLRDTEGRLHRVMSLLQLLEAPQSRAGEAPTDGRAKPDATDREAARPEIVDVLELLWADQLQVMCDLAVQAHPLTSLALLPPTWKSVA